MRTSGAVLVLSLFAAASVPLAQQAPSSAPSSAAQPDSVQLDSALVPTIQVTSRLVVLDVVVTDDKGRPAHGLKPSDFAITEDGVPQKLASFAERGSLEAATAAPLPPNTFTVQTPPPEDQTKTVIVLTDATSWSATADMPQFPSGSVANTGYVRKDIADFLKTAPSTEPVAIVRLDWQGMHLVQGLTADRNILMEAIGSKRMQPPLGFVVRFARAVGSPGQQLGRYIKSIPGRVNLVFITYGGGTPLGEMRDDFPDIADVVGTLGQSSRALRVNQVATYIIPLTQGNIWANSAMEQMAKAGGGHAYFTGVKQALSEIAATGSDYYTISYVPTNPDWNGRFRHVNVNVTGFPVPVHAESWAKEWSELLGWTEPQKSKVLYRPGYYARAIPETPDYPVATRPGAALSAQPPRRVISYSPKGAPNTLPAATAIAIGRAMDFGTLTPDRLKFSIVTTPSTQEKKLAPGETLPKENFLTPPFRAVAYRNVRIHYWIDPQNLNFTQAADGSYGDALQFVAIIYRDDGVEANSISSSEQVRLSADAMEDAVNSGIVFDQTIAVPVAGNPLPGSFFLRAAVSEKSTGKIGAIEVPADWIKPSPQANQLAESAGTGKH